MTEELGKRVDVAHQARKDYKSISKFWTWLGPVLLHLRQDNLSSLMQKRVTPDTESKDSHTFAMHTQCNTGYFFSINK